MSTPSFGTAGHIGSGSPLPRPWPGQFGLGGSDTLAMKWSALHAAARAVAAIAGITPPVMTTHLKQVPGLLRDLDLSRRQMAEQAITDLCAIMEPGLAALATAVARGVHPASAARRLWQEFCESRDAIAEMAPRSPLR